MFFDDHKKAVTTIMSRRKPDGSKSMDNVPMKAEVVKTSDGEEDGRHVASQEMLGALHEKSPMKFMEALANFIDIHQSRKSE